ncbi:hypothetical protein CPB84DRAFT_1760386 [Gymnopilus junonius]|uniref:RFX-type winged-helix domain-containing protein n=1 Tax=Gymnopilus junonius TaxID=109634 RepID=A0A9P5P0Y0_GYMJU|nr:hypothetical protein CPB84DRAFT_1760386 [Gymnopilus junonius]
MATFVPRGMTTPANYYRPPTYPTQSQTQQRPQPTITDDYERWYTESTPSNRMSLSVRSGIHSEISWALDRLCRLANNEQFVFYPGLLDGLFYWPEWYVTEGYKALRDSDILFSSNPGQSRQRRYALECLFILRNTALHEPNARELAAHSHTIPLILNGLHNLEHSKDENTEALLHITDLLQSVAPSVTVHANLPPKLNPIPPLLRIVAESSNRTMIISSLTALISIFSNPSNSSYLSADSPALKASIQYLPLFIDKPLIHACLNYLYVHISHPSMARAFLLRPELSGVLKVLATLLLDEQRSLEKTFTLDITGPIHTASSTSSSTRDHELTEEELESLLGKPEPQRCYDWMRAMFVPKADGELTQVDFWNLYKDAFSPYADQYQLLVASDVIKNVTNVFPQAQAMVLPGPIQRFVVRGVDRRKESAANERYRCQWDRSQCTSLPFASPAELYEHVLQHLSSADVPELSCVCAHVLTHLSGTQLQKHPSQSDTITLPSENYPYPTENPTNRPPPPPRSTTITYELPIIDPPSTSLTALLIIRILFRTSFASADAAPRIDADHFGFPGVVEDTTDGPGEDIDFADGAAIVDEREGERRGRKAFIGIKKLLESVRIKDEALMGWVTEMTDIGGTSGTSGMS